MITLERHTSRRSPASRIAEFLAITLTAVTVAEAVVACVQLATTGGYTLAVQVVLAALSLGTLWALVARKRKPAIIFALLTIVLYSVLTVYGLEFVSQSHFSFANWVAYCVDDLEGLVPFLATLYLYIKGEGFWDQDASAQKVGITTAIFLVPIGVAAAVPYLIPGVVHMDFFQMMVRTMIPVWFVGGICFHLAYREANRYAYATMFGLAVMTCLSGVMQYSTYRDQVASLHAGPSTGIDAATMADLTTRPLHTSIFLVIATVIFGLIGTLLLKPHLKNTESAQEGQG